KGTLHFEGAPVAFTGEVSYQGADQSKTVIEGELCGVKLSLVSVLNRDKGWNRLNGETEEMDEQELAETREEAYLSWVATLTPLKGQEFTLTPLPETRVEGRAAVGFQAAHKGHRDVKLYFDKENSLLVKTEAQSKDEDGMDVLEEAFYRDYQELQGVRQ